MTGEMIILTRTYDLLTWLLPKAESFPKVYRQTLTRRLQDAALDFQEALFDAQTQGGTTRQKHLRTADAALAKLRLYLRLAHRWQWLSAGQYQHVSLMTVEIGKLLGGWTKITHP
jgi:hypothetical protein